MCVHAYIMCVSVCAYVSVGVRVSVCMHVCVLSTCGLSLQCNRKRRPWGTQTLQTLPTSSHLGEEEGGRGGGKGDRGKKEGKDWEREKP